MQDLQKQLLEKDEELEKMFQVSLALQEQIQEQVPVVESQLQTMHRHKKKKAKEQTPREREELQETLDVAKDCWRLQEQLATKSASALKDAQFRFWKARQTLVRNAIA